MGKGKKAIGGVAAGITAYEAGKHYKHHHDKKHAKEHEKCDSSSDSSD